MVTSQCLSPFTHTHTVHTGSLFYLSPLPFPFSLTHTSALTHTHICTHTLNLSDPHTHTHTLHSTGLSLSISPSAPIPHYIALVSLSPPSAPTQPLPTPAPSSHTRHGTRSHRFPLPSITAQHDVCARGISARRRIGVERGSGRACGEALSPRHELSQDSHIGSSECASHSTSLLMGTLTASHLSFRDLFLTRSHSPLFITLTRARSRSQPFTLTRGRLPSLPLRLSVPFHLWRPHLPCLRPCRHVVTLSLSLRRPCCPCRPHPSPSPVSVSPSLFAMSCPHSPCCRPWRLYHPCPTASVVSPCLSHPLRLRRPCLPSFLLTRSNDCGTRRSMPRG